MPRHLIKSRFTTWRRGVASNTSKVTTKLNRLCLISLLDEDSRCRTHFFRHTQNNTIVNVSQRV